MKSFLEEHKDYMLADANSESAKARMQSSFLDSSVRDLQRQLDSNRLARISKTASQTSWRDCSARNSNSWSGRIEEGSGNANRRILQERIERKSRYNVGAHFTSTGVAGKNELYEWYIVDVQWKWSHVPSQPAVVPSPPVLDRCPHVRLLIAQIRATALPKPRLRVLRRRMVAGLGVESSAVKSCDNDVGLKVAIFCDPFLTGRCSFFSVLEPSLRITIHSWCPQKSACLCETVPMSFRGGPPLCASRTSVDQCRPSKAKRHLCKHTWLDWRLQSVRQGWAQKAASLKGIAPNAWHNTEALDVFSLADGKGRQPSAWHPSHLHELLGDPCHGCELWQSTKTATETDFNQSSCFRNSCQPNANLVRSEVITKNKLTNMPVQHQLARHSPPRCAKRHDCWNGTFALDTW